MAKKKSKEELDIDDGLDMGEESESTGGNKLLNILIVLIVIIIWLAIFALLIKMNVGGIGSMLRPYLKNIPGINMILPDATDEEVSEESGGKYKSLSEAIDRINELEAQLEQYQNSDSADSSTIAELQAEVARLKTFEENAQYYQDLKDRFDKEVVYADNAPDIENYKNKEVIVVAGGTGLSPVRGIVEYFSNNSNDCESMTHMLRWMLIRRQLFLKR